MAVWHMKTTGTRALASGASVAGDWTDANCFAPNSGVQEWWRILRDSCAAGDSIIFYDSNDGATLHTYDLEAAGSMVATAYVGTVTITSRSGDANQCELRNAVATTCLLVMNSGINRASVKFDGVTISGPAATYTGVARALVQMSGASGDLTFNDCILGNIVLGSTTELVQGLIYTDGNATAARSITFSGTNFIENITSSGFYGGVWIGFFSEATQAETINVSGTLTIRDITLTATTGGLGGGFTGSANWSITGDILAHNIVNTVNAAQINKAAIVNGGNMVMSPTASFTARDITYTGGGSSCVGLHHEGSVPAPSTFTTYNVTGQRITITPTAGNNSTGGLHFASNNASGNVSNVLAEDIRCFSGPAIYYSRNASGVAMSIIVRRCHAGEHGALYSGGWGDVEFIGFLVEDCTSDGPGAACFAHNHPADSTRAKTVRFKHGTIRRCQGNLLNLDNYGAGHGININNASTTYALTAEIENVIVRNGFGSNEISLDEDGLSTLNVTLTRVDVDGGAAGINSSGVNLGAITLTSITDIAELQGDGQLITGNALRFAAPAPINRTAFDALGRRYYYPSHIGGFADGARSPAETRAAAVSRSPAA